MNWYSLLAIASLLFASVAHAQDTATDETADAPADTAEAAPADDADAPLEETEEGLLTQAEIETLVAPVALYPDTLLIQILVAATQPFEVVKADRMILENADTDPEVLQAEIEAQGWDPSVEVLAVGFPEIIADMAQHIEWTEAMGDAMNAQTDDVMDAVQVLRNQAINSGALVSGEEQTVSMDEEENVIVQPTDPEVVYVPQYDPVVVYEDSSSSTGDLLTAAAITFGTVWLIDEIFNDDDDWYRYWGCRNCGWGGGGIYPRPGDIEIDIDGDVIIGNDINIGNGDRERPRPRDGAWEPDDRDREKSRDRIADSRGPNGDTRVPINKASTNSDQLRSQLSERSGAADISRDRAGSGDRPQVNRPSNRSEGAKRDAIRNTGADRSKAGNANRTQSPGVSRPKSAQKPSAGSRPANVSRPAATKKQSSGARAKAASQRGGGKAHGGGGGRQLRR